LKVIADVGLVGVPNAGKSTLLAALTAAQPKIADYPFTTLEPGLGILERGYQRLVLADIPGLIEGAHEGAGLGLGFLRHIERTRALLHVIDGSAEDPLAEYGLVRRELDAYSPALAGRPEVVVINKADLAEVAERADTLRGQLSAAGVAEVFVISAAIRTGLEPLVEALFREVEANPLSERVQEEVVPVLRPPAREAPVVEREADGAWRVHHRRAGVVVQKLDVRDWHARREVIERLRRVGVVRALEAAGAQTGDSVRIGEAEWTWEG
jgi:GTP-binding protein